MPRSLKVFQAHLGFYDTVVAAPSRAAALKAWGSRQNLFRDGTAKETQDPQAVAAARAKPGVVLRRAAGSNSPFGENPELPKIPNARKVKPGPKKVPAAAPHEAPNATAPRSDAPRAAAPPQLRVVRAPDRAPVERAEKALTELKREEERAIGRIKARKDALDQEERKLRDDYHARRLEAERLLMDARRAFQNALKRG
jgi:hypothetical protein